jgi:hypothetical protein
MDIAVCIAQVAEALGMLKWGEVVDLHGYHAVEGRVAVLCMLAAIQERYRQGHDVTDLIVVTGVECGHPTTQFTIVRDVLTRSQQACCGHRWALKLGQHPVKGCAWLKYINK